MFQSDGSHGGSNTGTEVRLDEEMEKVFSMSGTDSERFDMARLHDHLSDTPPNLPRHFNEMDYARKFETKYY